jgi:hypothetical protein
MTITDLSYLLKVRKEIIHTWIIDGCPHDVIMVNGKLQYYFDLRELEIWRTRRGMGK